MGLWGRLAGGPAPRVGTDVGVPDLREPEHVLIRPLRAELTTRDGALYQSRWTVDIESVDRPTARALVVSGTRPYSGLAGLVVDFPVPGLVDRADPAVPYFVEPPCGFRTPIIEPGLARLRDERDGRALELRARYPVPPLDDLVARFRAAPAPPADPIDAAVRWRLALLTTDEAARILDRVRAQGGSWEEADARMSARSPMAMALGRQIGATLSHLDDVAAQAPAVDIEPLYSIGMTIAQRDTAVPETTDDLDRIVVADDYTTVIQPLLDVCGPL